MLKGVFSTKINHAIYSIRQVSGGGEGGGGKKT